MVRVLSLLWTMVGSVIVSSLSFFYLNEDGSRHGFPFSFAHEVTQDGLTSLSFSVLSYLFDVIFWWFIFSILLIVVKNYVFEAD